MDSEEPVPSFKDPSFFLFCFTFLSALNEPSLFTLSSLTDIICETPAFSIDTPYSMSAISIVILLCDISMNWVPLKLFTRFANLTTFMSSRGASISSMTQKGLAFIRKSANKSDIAVIAFSPPESSDMFCSFFPGGLAMISIPDSRMLSLSVSTRSASPPLNIFMKTSANLTLITSKAFSNSSFDCSFVFFMTFIRFSLASVRSSYWVCRKSFLFLSSLYSSMATRLMTPSLSIFSLYSSTFRLSSLYSSSFISIENISPSSGT